MQLNLAKEKRVENIHFETIFSFEILNVVKKKNPCILGSLSLSLKYFSWQDIFLVGYDGRYLIIIFSIGLSMTSLFLIWCKKHIFWIFYHLCWNKTFYLLRTLKQFFSLRFWMLLKKRTHVFWVVSLSL